MKKTTFKAEYTGTGGYHGKFFTWKFWRDARYGWILEDWQGYERVCEKNWHDSLPVIRRILSNHGMTCTLS